ncbi:hypothetical protein AMAG_10631 [Allomyces macrogynus ATCC 38327]|uniref:Uncharacterized protein n=1 Tax=Allomyces macrogynus (strain ATCC 38327) TaxID=578462 RepID=A0A0L0SR48_ALLM3|nr:hypothetical protein AMAG_10631 [Allomyces macrogynus ATCC 38327]|eukprot:KNE64966.1 hypothetical protein AMAG_10631 [Allomyces macrogynus ATCC 38327]
MSRSADTMPPESASKKRRIRDTDVNEAPLRGVPSTAAGYLVDLHVALRLYPKYESVRIVGIQWPLQVYRPVLATVLPVMATAS